MDISLKLIDLKNPWHRLITTALICSIVLSLISCSKPLRKFPYYKDIIPEKNQVELSLTNLAKDSITILYLGCGHLVITSGTESIMTDPFFSTQNFKQTVVGKIKTNEQAYRRYNALIASQSVNLKSIKSIWISHSHYDHMMDLPLMLQENCFSPGTPIYGNEFGKKIMHTFLQSPAYPYHAIDPSAAYCKSCSSSPPSWIKAASSIRVMPILSQHAPHAKFLFLNIHLMTGELNQDYFINKFTSPYAPTKASQWREGDSFSFLVDFLSGDSVTFRMFIQTSASKFPYGAPPQATIQDRPVDLAILCAASSTNVKNYPTEIMNYTKAKKMLLIHWEDFFGEPLDFDHPQLVPLTRYKKVAQRLTDWNVDVKNNVLMPRPGTRITLTY